MTRITPAPIEGNAFHRALGHRPDILEKWYALDGSMRFSGLDPELKEEVRRVIADKVGCTFCSSLGRPDAAKRDGRTAVAVAFAETVCANIADLPAIDDEVFDVLKQEFSEPEIVELVVWTLFMIAGSAFGALMKVPPASTDEFAEYQRWRAEGEAAARSAV
ncbi:carboxymuconolactone decarboxylase family protein [Roseitalea porphyridii]|uniref:Carboxymuconolactone decarboxylase family protein n=1 Tax=Roseitalea porphyridii TaxID=1852022 RepID=A0A4P6V2Q4_9HYPH|nr:carboxymuconolactone decarboxylase family protein [Roseitalea porphyridii]QBK30876.1 carboxymuconolactone decarboxylase family protein [Roseitalea porphyridii]